MDRLTALNVFRAVAEHRSFAVASRRLGLSPAAVSKNISELEAHLNARLFNRTTRHISLTEAGLLYYDRIAPALDELSGADRLIGQIGAGPTGLLKVAAPVSLSLVCLVKLIPQFLADYPDISIRLDMDDRKVDIIDGGYDVAIRGSDRLEDSSLVAKKLMELPHVVCAAPSYLSKHTPPVVPADLGQHQCLGYVLSDHAKEWIFMRGSDRVRVPVTGRFAATSSLAVREAAAEGLGLALLPRAYVEDDLAKGRLVHMLGDWQVPVASVHAIYPSRHQLTPKLRVFLDFLAKRMS